MVTAEDRALIDAAYAAQAYAFAPYSNFHVGSAVRAADGRVFSGCNVEISSFSHTCCAERVAVFKAVSEGATALVAVAVITDDPATVTPCGACRQVLHDFGGPTMRVVLGAPSGDIRVLTLGELLPSAFGPERVLEHIKRGG